MAELNVDILELIQKRMAQGRVTYGHGLKEDSGYDWVKEALEEALDLSIYLSARLVELQRREARKVWGDAMTDEELKKWVEMKNTYKPGTDDPSIPKGETVSRDYCPKCANIVTEKTSVGNMRCLCCTHEWWV
jgi:hypothetical protein